jgi:hypothetical protein
MNRRRQNRASFHGTTRTRYAQFSIGCFRTIRLSSKTNRGLGTACITRLEYGLPECPTSSTLAVAGVTRLVRWTSYSRGLTHTPHRNPEHVGASRRHLSVDNDRVPLFDLTHGSLVKVPTTTFSSQGVLERTHLQAALRDNIAVLGDDLLVVSEEFGDFAGANRRIDLLCIDRTGRLVVIELKRTEDGGHMELQALCYAAMVSTMTPDRLEAIYRRHLSTVGDDPDLAEHRLVSWVTDEDDLDTVPTRDPRIILVAAGFGIEITATVLWLNEFHDFDIRCIRLTPYTSGEQLLVRHRTDHSPA